MNRQIRRILVALDASAPSRAALESAALLARGLDAELLGVFVQDLELMNLARLPMAREMGLTSASVRALDVASMELAMAAQARKAQRTLEAIARHHGLRWSFRITRGAVVNELLAAAAEAEVLALGISGQMEIAGRRFGSTVRGIIAAARCSVLIEQRPDPRSSAILLVYEDSPASARALERARQLSTARKAALIIAVNGPPDAHARLNASLVDKLGDVASRVRVEPLSDGAAQLRALMERNRCGLVVLPMDSTLLSDDPDLLAQLRCPVLLEK